MGQTLTLPNQPNWSLDQKMEFLEDPTGELTLEQVQRRDDWREQTGSTFNKGYSDSAWWLRLSLSNPLEMPRRRLLSIAYPVLGDVQVYQVPSRGERVFYQMGHNYPYSQRPIDHRHFVVPVEWEAGETVSLYLRIESDTSVQAPITLWDPDTFYSHDTTRNILHGIYFGALLVIGVYNLLLFFALGDRNYLYYVGFVSFMGLIMAALTGFGFRHLWPAATQWNDQAILFFLSGTLAFAALFSRRFLRIRQISRTLDILAVTLLVVSVLCGILSFYLPYRLVIALLIPLVVAGCMLGFGGGLYAWYRGQVTAKYYVLAWSFLLTGASILALSKGGVLPSNAFTDHAAQLGSLFEVVLLSFALAQRINVERRLRYEAQSETLATARRLNMELEDRVHERTRELESLNRKLNELSVTDELTGLRNRRHMDHVLRLELERAKRSGRPLAVALLDIDHFKPVNDNHGHPVGDECLKLVSEIIHAGLRWPSDTATRYGGEEFAIIFPDTDAQGAFVVVERIRERIRETRIEVDELMLSLTVSAGIYSPPIHPSLTPEELLRGADEGLYQAKENGRDKTCIFAPATLT
ncbi:MAG: 7TM diverse intracellular signaling domain-containing protein [Oleiphilaceae bacterium]|nr:7TM diverse intracellular signaling domain-containing protein [Oleiphilaceae bacterium]